MAHILMSRGNLNLPHFVETLKPYIKENMNVVVVALSYFDFQFKDHPSYLESYHEGGEYYLKMESQFTPYGIKMDQVTWILDGIDSTEEAISKIKEADIIYFPGGAPDRFMARIDALGIRQAIEAHKGLFIGSSAGAMIQFKQYHISKDNEYKRFSYESGLDLITGFSVEVHYRRKVKQKSAMRKVYRAYQEPILGLPDDGLIVFDTDTIHLYFGASIIYGNRGIYQRK